MTNQEAFYIVGNIPIPTNNENYDICQYQEAKAIALDCIQKIDDIETEIKVFNNLDFFGCDFILFAQRIKEILNK